MKLKQRTDDFRVEELTDVVPGDRGPFAFYRLIKQGWTTPDAVAAIRHRWRIDANRVAFGGLKDRHARTVQYLTILGGPRRGLSQNGLTLVYLGQIETVYESRAIRANHFAIIIRDLSNHDAARGLEACNDLRVNGVPNYFDDQRFGSVGPAGLFIGKLLVLGRFEEALKLALTAPYEFDRPAQRREKAALRRHWGRWDMCFERLPSGHSRNLAGLLKRDPTDFRRAISHLRPDLQGLYLSAYQSVLWNRILSMWLDQWLPPAQRFSIATKLGALTVPQSLDVSQGELLTHLQITLPAARSPFDPATVWSGAAASVLQGEGLAWSDLKVPGVRKPFFTRGERAALCRPEQLAAESSDDELHTGRRKLCLDFTLPRGSYATLLVHVVMSDRASPSA